MKIPLQTQIIYVVFNFHAKCPPEVPEGCLDAISITDLQAFVQWAVLFIGVSCLNLFYRPSQGLMKKNTKSSQPVNDEYIRESKNAVILDLGKKMNFSDVKTNQQVRLLGSDGLLELHCKEYNFA